MADVKESAAPEASTPPADAGADVSPPVKRGRGRPRKSDAPETPAPVSDGPKPPGKKPGRPKKARSSVDASALSQQIVGLHAFAAIATGIPECNISEQEGAILGTALAAVAEEYGLELGGKSGAMLQLFAAVAMVYVPRVMSVKARAKAAKDKRDALAAVAGDGNG